MHRVAHDRLGPRFELRLRELLSHNTSKLENVVPSLALPISAYRFYVARCPIDFKNEKEPITSVYCIILVDIYKVDLISLVQKISFRNISMLWYPYSTMKS
jgi:hypothetical protein